jgi:hypothetical protein
MRRFHLFEIEDQAWCPVVFRNAATDYLQFIINATSPYKPVISDLGKAIKKLASHRIVDLCSGGGGPWLQTQRELEANGVEIDICLTDRYPNLPAFEQIRSRSKNRIDYYPNPVDATSVPEELTGFRTIFTALHHFRPEDARAILLDAVKNRQGIGVFEVTERSPSAILIMTVHLLLVLILTPFIRPFRWSRLFFTYLIPIIPIIVWFDGVVSCLRTYTLEELTAMVESISDRGYHWEIAKKKSVRALIPVTYAIGYPEKR